LCLAIGRAVRARRRTVLYDLFSRDGLALFIAAGSFFSIRARVARVFPGSGA